GRSMIARVVAALRDGGAAYVVVVSPPEGAPGEAELTAEAAQAGAALIITPYVQPPDMRSSVELAVRAMEAYQGPADLPQAVLLAPGDSPGLTPALVVRVILAARANPGRIVVPTVAGKRGHPVALPWAVAQEIRKLPEGVGVNALVARHAD